MPSFNPTAIPFNLTSIKFGISPSECECDDCKNHLLKSIVFGQMSNNYLCTAGSSESLLDNPEPANSCVGEPEAEVYRYHHYRKTARSMSVPTLSTIPEEDEDLSSSEEDDSFESSCELSSAGMFEPNFASQCLGDFMHEVSSWSPEMCYSDPGCDAQAERGSFYPTFSDPFGPCGLPHDAFELQAPQYCQREQFTQAQFDDMPQPQYYQSGFYHPPCNESSMPDHYFGTPFIPYYKFDYAQYNSHSAQNQYPFPVQGPAQFILDHSMFGEKIMVAAAGVDQVENVPVEYVEYSVDEGEDWVYVDRELDA